MNGKYTIGDVVLDNWTLVKPLGEGAYGKVYEARREVYQNTYTAAVKIMTIPSSPSEIESARAEGMDDESIRAYFDGFVGSVVNEFTLMSELKGTANIVSCEDFRVIPHTEGLGWDILIRMELLTPMLKYMSGHEMTRSDVIKLGVDMCKALELCQRYNIIHRDIKPENIFLSRTGDYKLGDFGVARTLEKTTGGLSKKGTYTYMAPEVYRDEKYGPTVDIYSLGIVLYRLLNNNRAPFLPAPPQPISYSERERALERRISGEELPPPANAGGRLGGIVLKACAFEAKDRYQSPQQMRQELEAIQGSAEEEPDYDSEETLLVERGQYTGQSRSGAADATVCEPRRTTGGTPGADEATVYEPHSTSRSAKAQPTPAAPAKKKKTALIAVIAAALVLGAIALLVLLPKGKPAEPAASAAPAPAEETAPPSDTPEITPEPTPAPVETPEPSAQAVADASLWMEGDWSWSLTGGVLTISGTGNMADYSSSDSKSPWSNNAREITQIVIEDGITHIGDQAFSDCERLSSVTIPGSVSSIGKSAFSRCYSLTELTLPEGVTSIGESAFSGCTMTSITLPESLASIGDGAFSSCRLKTVTIPEGVSSIGEQTFSACGDLSAIEVEPGNRYYKSIDGVLFTQDGKMLLCCPAGRSQSYQIPDGVTVICEQAFAGCYNLSDVTIPSSVTEISDYAFSYCGGLTSMTIPEGVSVIGEYVFYECEQLRSVSIPASVIAIGTGALNQGVPLSQIEVASDSRYYKAVDGVLFTQNGKRLVCFPPAKTGPNYVVPDGVAEIGSYAFFNCSLTKVTLPAGLTAIGDYAFGDCGKLRSAVIPDGVTSIGKGAYSNCSALTQLTIPGSVVRIGESAFSNCKTLGTVVIPEGVTTIGSYAFNSCDRLSSLSIPQSVTSIGYGAFSRCDKLKTVYFKGSKAQWEAVSVDSQNDPLKNASFRFSAS